MTLHLTWRLTKKSEACFSFRSRIWFAWLQSKMLDKHIPPPLQWRIKQTRDSNSSRGQATIGAKPPKRNNNTSLDSSVFMMLKSRDILVNGNRIFRWCYLVHGPDLGWLCYNLWVSGFPNLIILGSHNVCSFFLAIPRTSLLIFRLKLIGLDWHFLRVNVWPVHFGVIPLLFSRWRLRFGMTGKRR